MRCGSRSAGVWVRNEPVKVVEIDGTGGLTSPKQYQQCKLGTLITFVTNWMKGSGATPLTTQGF